MRYEIGLGYRTDDDGRRVAYVLMERFPTWLGILGDVAYKLCGLTRQRLCHRLCNPAFQATDRRAERFELDCPPEQVAAYAAWRGWDTWPDNLAGEDAS